MEAIASEFQESETFGNDVAIQDSLDRHLACSMEDKSKSRLFDQMGILDGSYKAKMKNFGNAFCTGTGETRAQPVAKVRIPKEVEGNSKQITELTRFTDKETKVTKAYILAKDRE